MNSLNSNVSSFQNQTLTSYNAGELTIEVYTLKIADGNSTWNRTRERRNYRLTYHYVRNASESDESNS